MKTSGITVLIYGVLVLVGGLMGYLKAGSAMSLIMGLCFGIALLVSAQAMLKNKPSGLTSAFILSFVLCAFFIYRFFITSSFMPAGLMAILSLIVILVLFSSKNRNKAIDKL